MKIKGRPGEIGFKALIYISGGWVLTEQFYFSQAEVYKFHGDVRSKWPVEMIDENIVYIPSEEELENEA